MCDVLDATTLKPQNLVQNANSKTHLTNHYFGIRSGKNLSKVVEATRNNTNPRSHISIIQITITVINRGLKVLIESKSIF